MTAEKLPKPPKAPKVDKPLTSDKTTNDLIENLIRSMILEASETKDVETKLKVAKHAMQWEAVKAKTSMAGKWGAGLMGDDDDPITNFDLDETKDE